MINVVEQDEADDGSVTKWQFETDESAGKGAGPRPRGSAKSDTGGRYEGVCTESAKVIRSLFGNRHNAPMEGLTPTHSRQRLSPEAAGALNLLPGSRRQVQMAQNVQI